MFLTLAVDKTMSINTCVCVCNILTMICATQKANNLNKCLKNISQ